MNFEPSILVSIIGTIGTVLVAIIAIIPNFITTRETIRFQREQLLLQQQTEKENRESERKDKDKETFDTGFLNVYQKAIDSLTLVASEVNLSPSAKTPGSISEARKWTNLLMCYLVALRKKPYSADSDLHTMYTAFELTPAHNARPLEFFTKTGSIKLDSDPSNWNRGSNTLGVTE